MDPAHSEIQFKVRHLMISNVTGQFRTFTSEVETASDEFKDADIKFNAEVASIDTTDEQRNNHLKSEDFFNVANFPQLTFEAKGYDATSGKLNGDLTIKNITKPVSLDVEHLGTNKDPYGNIKAGFSLSGVIDRTEFDLTWNTPLEAGGMLLSNDVKIMGEVQFVKQA